LFGRFKTLCQLLDRLVFVADQRIDKVSLVLLLELLLTHVLDTLVDKFNFITKLLALRILRLKVAFELCQQNHIVRFDHALQTQTEFALEADQIV